MKSSSVVAKGSQEPRYAVVPDFAWSEGDDACFLADGYGLTADPWQEAVIQGWLGVDADGAWVCSLCGLAVPRQNGKNGIVEIVELYKLVVLGRKILHTAHEVKTARKAFLRLASFFENPREYPELAAMVKEVRRTNGQEAIVLDNGGSIEYVARSRGSGRGFTVDDLVLDEAQELTDEQLEALMYTISASPSGKPQTIMIGTPPPPTAPGEVWLRVRSAGISGSNPRLGWFEWSPRLDEHDQIVGGLDDPAVWAENNPALGYRLSLQTVQDERIQASDDGFARERLGLWIGGGTAKAPAVISKALWDQAKVVEAPETGVLSYGVKFSPDGQVVAMAVALKPWEGPIHVEGLTNQLMVAGTGPLVAFLRDRWRGAASIVVDGKAGAGAFIAALRVAGVPERRIVTPTVEQVVAAHTMLLAAVIGGDLTHIDDPALAGAIASAGRRKIGNTGGWGLESVDGGDITLAEAVVMAHFGASIAKRRRAAGSSRSGSGRRATVA